MINLLEVLSLLDLLLSTQLLLQPQPTEQHIKVDVERSVITNPSTFHLDTPSIQKTTIVLDTKGREDQMKRAEQSFLEEEAEKARLWKLRREAEIRKKERQRKNEERIRIIKEKAKAMLSLKKKEAPAPSLRKTSNQGANTYSSAEVTAYYAAPDSMQGGGITATGHNLYSSITYQGYRIVAAPPEIPFGTLLEFNLDSGRTIRAVVLDRGGRIHNGVFDLALSSREECINFGRQKGKYTVIGHLVL